MIKLFKNYSECYYSKVNKKIVLFITEKNRIVIDYQMILNSQNICIENNNGKTYYDKSF